MTTLRRCAMGMAALLLTTAASCGKYESCDPGQVLQFNVCIPLPDAAADGAGASDGSTAPPPGACNVLPLPDGGATMCSGATDTSGFGRACRTDGDCPCGTDLCAVQAGASCGFCTRRACLANPSICPASWTCFDASAFQPGFSLCIKL